MFAEVFVLVSALVPIYTDGGRLLSRGVRQVWEGVERQHRRSGLGEKMYVLGPLHRRVVSGV